MTLTIGRTGGIIPFPEMGFERERLDGDGSLPAAKTVFVLHGSPFLNSER